MCVCIYAFLSCLSRSSPPPHVASLACIRCVAAQGDDGLDHEYLGSVMQYVSELGCQALVLTVDTANNANREKTYKNPQWIVDMSEQCGGLPAPRSLEGLNIRAASGHTAALTWADVRRVRAEAHRHGMALVLKGIMTGEDTLLAVAAGVDAVLVSNHGGRQLDGTAGTIEVLEECVRAAAGSDMEVYLDGGVRRGKDVFKALALGAKAVFVGRPALWGLGVGGTPGVERVLGILNEELVTVMQLCGCPTIRSITRTHVSDAAHQRQ